MSERPDATPPKEPTCAHCGILVSGCECPVILSRYAPPSDAAQPIPDGWVSCPSIRYSGREYAIVWHRDRPFLCYRIDGRWMIEHTIGHPEDAPEGPWEINGADGVWAVVNEKEKRELWPIPTEPEAIAVRDALNREVRGKGDKNG